MLRLLCQGNTQDFPRLHHSQHAQSAYPLYCLGQELSLCVCSVFDAAWKVTKVERSELFGLSEESSFDSNVGESEQGKLQNLVFHLPFLMVTTQRKSQACKRKQWP